MIEHDGAYITRVKNPCGSTTTTVRYVTPRIETIMVLRLSATYALSDAVGGTANLDLSEDLLD